MEERRRAEIEKNIAEQKLRYRVEFEHIVSQISSEFVGLEYKEIDTGIATFVKHGLGSRIISFFSECHGPHAKGGYRYPGVAQKTIVHFDSPKLIAVYVSSVGRLINYVLIENS